MQEAMPGDSQEPRDSISSLSQICSENYQYIPEGSGARMESKGDEESLVLASSHKDLFGHFYVVCPPD